MSIKESFKTRTALAATKVCCIKMIDKSWNVNVCIFRSFYFVLHIKTGERRIIPLRELNRLKRGGSGRGGGGGGLI